MTFAIFIPLICITASLAPEPWSQLLDPSDGATYFNVAEELAAQDQLSQEDRKLITELYVLAAVSDPIYRDSSIIGIISILQDDELRAQLLNLKKSPPLLVPSLVQQVYLCNTQNQTKIEELCSTLTTLRQGKTITTEQSDSLKPWLFMFPSSFEPVFRGTQSRRRFLTTSEVEVTLKVELAVLGGSSQWSADLTSSGGHPVTINMSDDLASLLSVDPIKRIRKNGRWVSKESKED